MLSTNRSHPNTDARCWEDLHLTSSQQLELTIFQNKRVEYCRQNESFHFGTSQLVWYQPHPPEVYFFNWKGFNNETKNKVTDGHLNKAKDKYPALYNYFKEEHDKSKYISVPRRLNILSYERPRHQIDTKKGGKMGEYRFPVRYVMDDDDDDIISGLKRMPEKAPCIFCLGHSYSDNCTKFLTPASRLRRLRNINYTLFLNGVLQVCPCCLSREVGHPGYKLCKERCKCHNCKSTHHQSAICTSATHAICVLTRDKTRVLTQSLVDDFIYSNQCILDYEQERIAEHEFNIRKQAKDDFLQRLHTPGMQSQLAIINDDYESDSSDDEEQQQNEPEYRRPRNQAAQGFPGILRDCVDAELLDVHYDHHMFKDLRRVNTEIASFNFNAQLRKLQFARHIDELLTQVEQLYCCSRLGCSSGRKATFFCRCGGFRLCAACLIGRKNLTYRFQKNKSRQCTGECNSVIMVPNVPGLASFQDYMAKQAVVISQAKMVRNGLYTWAHASDGISPDMDNYIKHVHMPVEMMRRQFKCCQCKNFMDSETHVMMKGYCDCGLILCRWCVMSEHIRGSINPYRSNGPPLCYRILDGNLIYCVKCEKHCEGFGTCKALTLLATICRGLLHEEGAQDRSSMLQLFVKYMREAGLECRDDGFAPVVPLEPPTREPSPEPLDMGHCWRLPDGRLTPNDPTTDWFADVPDNPNLWNRRAVGSRDLPISDSPLVDLDLLEDGLPRAGNVYVQSEESDGNISDESNEVGEDCEDFEEHDNVDEQTRLDIIQSRKELADNINQGVSSVDENVEKALVAEVLPSNDVHTTHPSSDVPLVENNNVFRSTTANLTGWQRALLNIQHILIVRKDKLEAMPNRMSAEDRANSNNQLDLQRALSDICAFIAEGPDRHIHPAPLSSLSQLSASTPSYADDQNAGVATHPITKSSTVKEDKEDENEGDESW